MNNIDTLIKWIDESNNICFFGGAGVSTESGIPDFRSVDGLYNQKYDYPPEMIISHSFFMNNTKEFYRFYKDRMIYKEAKPNITHITLAKLEEMGKLNCIITQNIDGLHLLAGSKKVIELHGTTLRNYCMNCHQEYSLDELLEKDSIPYCDKCGGIIKPDVVLYEEGLNAKDLDNAIRAISKSDLLIIGGTSLVVQPAASLIRYYAGDRMVLINLDQTPYDEYANLVIHTSLGEVFKKINDSLK